MPEQAMKAQEAIERLEGFILEHDGHAPEIVPSHDGVWLHCPVCKTTPEILTVDLRRAVSGEMEETGAVSF